MNNLNFLISYRIVLVLLFVQIKNRRVMTIHYIFTKYFGSSNLILNRDGVSPLFSRQCNGDIKFVNEHFSISIRVHKYK